MMDYIIWFFAVWGVLSFIKKMIQIATYWEEVILTIKEIEKEKK